MALEGIHQPLDHPGIAIVVAIGKQHELARRQINALIADHNPAAVLFAQEQPDLGVTS